MRQTLPQVLIIASSKKHLSALEPAQTQLGVFPSIVVEAHCVRQTEVRAFAKQYAKSSQPILVIVGSTTPQLPKAFAAMPQFLVIRVPIANAKPMHCIADLLQKTDSVSNFATVAVGQAGSKNAALLAISILALNDKKIKKAWKGFRLKQTREVLNSKLPV